jgi:hypothetical protein
MLKRLFATLGICLVLTLIPSAGTFAQEPDPADQVKSFLTAKGYTVVEVDYYPDEQGKPRPEVVYALMEAVSGNLDSAEIASQVVLGFHALRRYFPRADTLMSVLTYRKYAIFFSTPSATFDKFAKAEIGSNAFWNNVRGQVRIYDLVKKSYIDEKDFTSNNQTDKGFGSTPPNPVPTPVPTAPLKGAHLRLEPSTTYLPADDKTSVTLIAALLDANFVPLVGQALGFSYEAAGQDAQSLGTQATDVNGTARAQAKGPPNTDSLLLRVSTEALNSQVPIVVGPPVTAKMEQVDAVVEGLTKQGYADVEANFVSRTGPTGETINTGIASMRMASQTLDRAFYSQLSRAFGTLRTVFAKSNQLVVILVYRKEGQDWLLYWRAQTANWDQFVAGKIGENDFWRYLEYPGAYDEDGNRLDDKNFMDKNFGAGGGGKEARVTRALESTMKKETWGDQWRGQEFVILPGSYADTFTLTELSGNATAVQIFQSPEFRAPFLEFKRGDNPDVLKKWRLGQGQYLFAIVATSAPAAARMTYVEHLPQ